MKRNPAYVRRISLTVLAGFALSACGIKGELKTPPPLFGQDIRSEAQKAEVERAKAERAERAAQKAARKAAKQAEDAAKSSE